MLDTRWLQMITLQYLDVNRNSPNLYHKKYLENSEENLHVDIEDK